MAANSNSDRFHKLAGSKIVLTETIRVRRSDGPISADLGDEAAILDPASGVYFGLNEVGAVVWRYIDEERSVSEIVARVQDDYEVERERCEMDIIKLLNQLEATGLVVVVYAA